MCGSRVVEQFENQASNTTGSSCTAAALSLLEFDKNNNEGDVETGAIYFAPFFTLYYRLQWAWPFRNAVLDDPVVGRFGCICNIQSQIVSP